MSLSPDRRPVAFGNVGAVADAIRASGGRLSSARRIVLESLFRAEGPISAPDIADGLGGRAVGVEISAVYNSLLRLEELGVVRRIHIGRGPGLYAVEDGTEHEYVACDACGHLETIDPARLDRARAEIRDAIGYGARFTRFALIGRCPRCVREHVAGAPTSPAAAKCPS